MRILLDTNALLFAISEPERMFPAWQAQLDSTTSEIYVSSVSVAEVAIKVAIGKMPSTISLTATDFADYGFTELPFLTSHANAIRKLPLHHRDPFDRMIIAQAVVEDLAIMTTDQHFAAYTEARLVPQR